MVICMCGGRSFCQVTCSVLTSRVIPVVVARCGLYLKETATEVEGAFRISGSAKRMRDLQEIFDSPPRVGRPLGPDANDSMAKTSNGMSSAIHLMMSPPYFEGMSLVAAITYYKVLDPRARIDCAHQSL